MKRTRAILISKHNHSEKITEFLSNIVVVITPLIRLIIVKTLQKSHFATKSQDIFTQNNRKIYNKSNVNILEVLIVLHVTLKTWSAVRKLRFPIKFFKLTQIFSDHVLFSRRMSKGRKLRLCPLLKSLLLWQGVPERAFRRTSWSLLRTSVSIYNFFRILI